MMIRTAGRVLAVTAMSLMIASAAAVAQTTPPPAAAPSAAQPTTGEAAKGDARAGMAACRVDMQALCANVERGKGKKMQCLVENRAKASPECQAAMGGIQDRMADRAARKDGNKEGQRGAKGGRLAACRTDLATHCSDASKGGGRMQCLRQNEAKLSPECSTTLQGLKQARTGAAKAAREACKADAATLCTTSEPGRRGMMACLRQNEAKVSPACGQALAALPVPKRDKAQ